MEEKKAPLPEQPQEQTLAAQTEPESFVPKPEDGEGTNAAAEGKTAAEQEEKSPQADSETIPATPTPEPAPELERIARSHFKDALRIVLWRMPLEEFGERKYSLFDALAIFTYLLASFFLFAMLCIFFARLLMAPAELAKAFEDFATSGGTPAKEAVQKAPAPTVPSVPEVPQPKAAP